MGPNMEGSPSIVAKNIVPNRRPQLPSSLIPKAFQAHCLLPKLNLQNLTHKPDGSHQEISPTKLVTRPSPIGLYNGAETTLPNGPSILEDFVILPNRPSLHQVPTLPVQSASPATTTQGVTSMTESATPSPSPAVPITPIQPSVVNLKELRDRFNYAASSCAASVRSTNAEAKGASAILTENKDNYLLSPCQTDAGRHVVVELCDEILVDTIVLGNFELFSSTFHHVHVYINNVYPPTKTKPWRKLIELEAFNSRSSQVFAISRPISWTRYIKFEFISQFGANYYCPVSVIRIYGTTMLEEYKREQSKLTYGPLKPVPVTPSLPTIPKSPRPSLPEKTAPTSSKESPIPFPTLSSFQTIATPAPSELPMVPDLHQPLHVPFRPPKLSFFRMQSGKTIEVPGFCAVESIFAKQIPATTSNISGENSSKLHSDNSESSSHFKDGNNAGSSYVRDDFEAPAEEGIYKTIMKRFVQIESNYQHLLNYMDDYAKGINDVIRANDDNQAEHFVKSMVQLSQHLAARLSQIVRPVADQASCLLNLISIPEIASHFLYGLLFH
jgi:hypothetical protein